MSFPLHSFEILNLTQSSISKVFCRLLENGFAAGALFSAAWGAGFVSSAAHLASKRSSSWVLIAAGAVSWLPSGGQLLLPPPLIPVQPEVPFWKVVVALLCGGRPLMDVNSGGVEGNEAVGNPADTPGAPG